MTKKKTFVLMVAKKFPATHIRAGEPTYFKEQILAGLKIHTIRENRTLWQDRVKQINEGRAVLSIREWSDKPYRSKQIELLQLTKVGVQNVSIFPETKQIYVLRGQGTDADIVKRWTTSSEHRSEITQFCNNDGFDTVFAIRHFWSWFNSSKPVYGCILHFTNFKYQLNK